MKNKIGKAFLTVIILIIAFVVIFMSVLCRNKQSIYIDTKESFFSDFSIVGDKVEIVCYVKVCNKYNVDKTVLIKGNFLSEAENGLILEETLYAVDTNEDKCQYKIPAKSEESFYISFIGTFAGYDHMTSRKLPPISIEEIS